MADNHGSHCPGGHCGAQGPPRGSSPAEPAPDPEPPAPEKTSDTALWLATAAWLLRHRRLGGARMILAMMDQWASTVNVFANIIGCAPGESILYGGEAGYPLTAAEIEMADARTIAECKQRIRRLEAAAQARGLTPEEQEELGFIRRYLGEVSFRGWPRKFRGEARNSHRRKLEALRYTLRLLGRHDPALARYARSHLQTSPVFRWI